MEQSRLYEIADLTLPINNITLALHKLYIIIYTLE